MKFFSAQKVLGFLSVLFVFLSVATPAFADCDGWARDGEEHRNAGNGCSYVCRGSSWSGPTKCDGQGNGQFQGAAARSAEERARQAAAVAERNNEARKKVEEQGTSATAALAAATATQRQQEAVRQQAMVETQRQQEIDLARRAGASEQEIAEIEERANDAAEFVSQAQGTNEGKSLVGSNSQTATNIAATGEGSANLPSTTSTASESVSQSSTAVFTGSGSCDINNSKSSNLPSGSLCCRGGHVECASPGVCNAPGIGYPGKCAPLQSGSGNSNSSNASSGDQGPAPQSAPAVFVPADQVMYRINGSSCTTCSQGQIQADADACRYKDLRACNNALAIETSRSSQGSPSRYYLDGSNVCRPCLSAQDAARFNCSFTLSNCNQGDRTVPETSAGNRCDAATCICQTNRLSLSTGEMCPTSSQVNGGLPNCGNDTSVLSINSNALRSACLYNGTVRYKCKAGNNVNGCISVIASTQTQNTQGGVGPAPSNNQTQPSTTQPARATATQTAGQASVPDCANAEVGTFNDTELPNSRPCRYQGRTVYLCNAGTIFNRCGTRNTSSETVVPSLNTTTNTSVTPDIAPAAIRSACSSMVCAGSTIICTISGSRQVAYDQCVAEGTSRAEIKPSTSDSASLPQCVRPVARGVANSTPCAVGTNTTDFSFCSSGTRSLPDGTCQMVNPTDSSTSVGVVNSNVSNPSTVRAVAESTQEAACRREACFFPSCVPNSSVQQTVFDVCMTRTQASTTNATNTNSGRLTCPENATLFIRQSSRENLVACQTVGSNTLSYYCPPNTQCPLPTTAGPINSCLGIANGLAPQTTNGTSAGVCCDGQFKAGQTRCETQPTAPNATTERVVLESRCWSQVCIPGSQMCDRTLPTNKTRFEQCVANNGVLPAQTSSETTDPSTQTSTTAQNPLTNLRNAVDERVRSCNIHTCGLPTGCSTSGPLAALALNTCYVTGVPSSTNSISRPVITRTCPVTGIFDVNTPGVHEGLVSCVDFDGAARFYCPSGQTCIVSAGVGSNLCEGRANNVPFFNGGGNAVCCNGQLRVNRNSCSTSQSSTSNNTTPSGNGDIEPEVQEELDFPTDEVILQATPVEDSTIDLNEVLPVSYCSGRANGAISVANQGEFSCCYGLTYAEGFSCPVVQGPAPQPANNSQVSNVNQSWACLATTTNASCRPCGGSNQVSCSSFDSNIQVYVGEQVVRDTYRSQTIRFLAN